MTNYVYQSDDKYIYFLNDPQGIGMVYFKDIKERHKYSRQCIKGYLGDDGWSDAVEEISMGKVTHLSTEFNVTPRPNDCDQDGVDSRGRYWGDWCKSCDYKLTPIDSLLLDDTLDGSTTEIEGDNNPDNECYISRK